MRFFGTPVYFTIRSFVFFFLFGSIGWQLAANRDIPTQLIFFLASAGIALFSLLLHERAHVMMAARYGIGCRGIFIDMLGGASVLDSTGHRPKETFFISFVGPLTSFGLAGAIALALIPFAAALRVDTLWLNLFAYFSFINIAWGAFNLLPIFPLDGGRILHSVLWGRIRQEYRARYLTVKTGKVFIVVLALAAGAAVFFGFLHPFSFLWFLLIFWFLWQAQDQALTRNGGI